MQSRAERRRVEAAEKFVTREISELERKLSRVTSTREEAYRNQDHKELKLQVAKIRAREGEKAVQAAIERELRTLRPKMIEKRLREQGRHRG